MNRNPHYSALRLELGQVALYLGDLLTHILDREVLCKCQSEDDSYWSAAATNTRFSTAEIVSLVQYVGGDDVMLCQSMPTDTNFSRYLDMDLCRALLKKKLALDWEQEFPTKDALWLLGHWAQEPVLPEVSRDQFVSGASGVNCSGLLGMDAFTQRLFSYGGNYPDLARICECAENESGKHPYWIYPITDGDCTGCCLVLVQEGVLSVSYDTIRERTQEHFLEESAHLCTAEELRYLLENWNDFSQELTSVLCALVAFQERREGIADAKA